jgi:hypothetical protein
MDLEILKKIHNVMQRKFRKSILDGMYILKEDIETLDRGNITCIRFNEGVFKGFKSFDTNSIDAFELKKYGITVKGHEIENFEYTVDFDILINKMKYNINTYWKNWINGCLRFPTIRYISLYVSLKSIEWGVLGVSRLYYTFMEKDIVSKMGAGEYVLKNVPQRYHKILNEAMRLRKNYKKTYYKSIFQRRKDVIEYINYIIQESNKI